MTDKPSEAEEKAAEAEFQRVLGNLANMPHKPHAPSKPEPGRKRGRPKAN
ncbi:MAG: hypothetical protein Q8L66_04835 [Caulobacter sp.]|nr:hypothetical protein [Caulobacter sp.]